MSKGLVHESRAIKSIDWYTPPLIFEVLGLTFDLDPCSAGEGKDFVPAIERYTEEDDGLSKPWNGLVFCNPPYGSATAKWMRRMAEHRNGIALVFARTDTKWFQDIAYTTDIVCFVQRRIRFYAGNKTDLGREPGAGSMLIGWGDKARAAIERSELGVNAYFHWKWGEGISGD